MKQLRTLGACLLAVSAIGAAAASAAQAGGIQVGRCFEMPTHYGGKYSDANCTAAAAHRSGSYEWSPYSPSEYENWTMSGAGGMTLETAAGKKIECSIVGELDTTPTLRRDGLSPTPNWTFLGCQSEGQECHGSLSVEAGEVNNEVAYYEEGEPPAGWVGKYGYVSGKGGPSPVIGLQYQTRNAEEHLFPPIVCDGSIGTVAIGSQKSKASWIATLGPVNQMTHQFTQTYGESAPGVSDPTSFEHKKSDVLEAFLRQHWEPVAIVASFTQETEGPSLEIKATK